MTTTRRIDRLSRYWDLASIYLPVLIMGLLALGSYWLLRATPSAPEVAGQQPERHEPDYFMRGFSVRSHDDHGGLRREIFGSQARHYPDTGTLEIDDVRIRSFNDRGQLTTATAKHLHTDDQQSAYLLQGQVLVERPASAADRATGRQAMSFAGEQLRIHGEPQQIESDLPVELWRGPDRVTADTLRYDDGKRVADLEGRVHAVLQPRR